MLSLSQVSYTIRERSSYSCSSQRPEAAQEIGFGYHPDELCAINHGHTANAFGDAHVEQKPCQQCARQERLL
jgi:hypothetical protein